MHICRCMVYQPYDMFKEKLHFFFLKLSLLGQGVPSHRAYGWISGDPEKELPRDRHTSMQCRKNARPIRKCQGHFQF